MAISELSSQTAVSPRAKTTKPAARSTSLRRFGIEAEARSPGPANGERAAHTRQLILDTARDLFMSYGYGGTTVDRIAKSAGISRASVYTYYPTKRDVLLATGETAFANAESVIARLAEVSVPARVADLEKWAQDYLDFLEQHGAFVLVLSQAAMEDPELRRVGGREYRRAARKLATALTRLRAADGGEVPVSQAVAILALMERFAMWRASGMALIGDDAAATVARTIDAVLRSA